MLKLNDIIDLIRVNQTPTWTLSAKKNQFQNTRDFKGSYSPEDNEEENLDKTINKLQELSNYLKNEMVHCYVIELKAKKNSNKSGVLTYEFSLNESSLPVQQQQQPSNALNGIPEGYVTLGQLESITRTERALGEVKIKEMLLDRDRLDFEKQKKEYQEQLEKQKEYFNSDVTKVAKGFWVLGNHVFGELFKGAPEGLGKVQIREKELPEGENTNNEEFSDSEKIAADIAKELSDKYTNPNDMKKMQYFIQTFIKQQDEKPVNTINEDNNETKTTEKDE
jgi:hypothetical protein